MHTDIHTQTDGTHWYLTLLFIIRLQEKEGQSQRRRKREKRQHTESEELEKRCRNLRVSLFKGFCVCDAHGRIDVHDHLSSRLVALAVVGPFLSLLQHAVSGGAVLQGKLADDFTEPVDADLPHTVGWMPEVQQEWVEPGIKS